MSDIWHYRCERCRAWEIESGRENAIVWCRLHRATLSGSLREHSTIIWPRGQRSEAEVIGIGGDDA